MQDHQTNPDWSALLPVLPATGPRARALYRCLRQAIEGGSLPAGAKLPPTRDLAARFGLARGAAVAAYEQLVAEGFARAQVGAGTFVAEAVPHLAPAPPPQAAPAPAGPPLPGTLGVAFDDDRSRRLLRAALNRHLLPPGGAQLHYGDPRGHDGLRAEIAAYLGTARGLRCHPGQVVVTAGTLHGLDLVLRAVLAPGDQVWFEDPGYPAVRAALQGAGMALVPMPVDAQGLDVAAGRARAPRAAAAYVTPSHQFPTGTVMSMARRLALLDWARETGGWIIEDDYDSEFRHAGAPLSALQGLEDAGRVIYAGTFAKALLPGLRLGYLVLPPPLIEPVMALRARTDRMPPTLAEAAMAEFLARGHFAAHLRRTRRRATASAAALVQALQAAGLPARMPAQGLHLIAPLPEGTDDTALIAPLAAAGLAARALSPHHLQAPPHPGLILGFAGFSPQSLQAAVARAAPILAPITQPR